MYCAADLAASRRISSSRLLFLITSSMYCKGVIPLRSMMASFCSEDLFLAPFVLDIRHRRFMRISYAYSTAYGY